MGCKLSDVEGNIMKISDDRYNKSLCLHYKTKNEIDSRSVLSIIRYLKNKDWKNFNFSQYSVGKLKNDQDGDYVVITLNYIPPSPKF
jgi:hypothetical protein